MRGQLLVSIVGGGGLMSAILPRQSLLLFELPAVENERVEMWIITDAAPL